MKETTEYGDMDDDQIQNAAVQKALRQGGATSVASIKSKKTAASTAGGNESTMGGAEGKGNAKKNNDWIPTQAVRAILQIKEQF